MLSCSSGHLCWTSWCWFPLSSPVFSFGLFYRNPVHFNINLSPILFSALLHCINICGSFGIRPRGIHSTATVLPFQSSYIYYIYVHFPYSYHTVIQASSPSLMLAAPLILRKALLVRLHSSTIFPRPQVPLCLLIWMTLIYLVHDSSHFSYKCLQIYNLNGSKVSTAKAACAFKQLEKFFGMTSEVSHRLAGIWILRCLCGYIWRPTS